MNSNQTLLEIEKVKTKIEESLKRYGEYSTELIELYEEIADLYCSLNEFEECKKYLLKVLEIKRHFYGETIVDCTENNSIPKGSFYKWLGYYAKMLSEFHYISDYANYRNIKVNNLTLNSYIDSFNKMDWHYLLS